MYFKQKKILKIRKGGIPLLLKDQLYRIKRMENLFQNSSSLVAQGLLLGVWIGNIEQIELPWSNKCSWEDTLHPSPCAIQCVLNFIHCQATMAWSLSSWNHLGRLGAFLFWVKRFNQLPGGYCSDSLNISKAVHRSQVSARIIINTLAVNLNVALQLSLSGVCRHS